MYNTKELQDAIIALKKEKDVCILAHAYQTQDILEVADFIGDSFGLIQQAQTVPQKNLLMCGVRFMAETAKILSPDKTVILAHPDAGCPMAEQLTVDELKEIKAQYPGVAVVAYINTTSELKTECDVCVTSASALNIVKNLPNEEILFIPDCNLGSWIEKQVPEKKFHFIKGGCPVHMRITPADIEKARAAHPEAPILVHPECNEEVCAMADYIGSTSGIIEAATNREETEFIIGTEIGVEYELKKRNPDKRFYFPATAPICKDMKFITLEKILHVLKTGENRASVEEEKAKAAANTLSRMLELAK